MRSAIQRLSLTLALALGGTVAVAQDYQPISAVIDPAMDQDAAMDVVATLAEALVKAEFVTLDLAVVLPQTDDRTSRVSMMRGDSDPQPVNCGDDFARLNVAGSVLDVFVADIYPHLILSLRFGVEDAGLGHTVACTMREGQPLLVVKGRFYVSSFEIPTAYNIQLVAARL